MKSGESGAIRSVCGGQAHLYRASQVTWHHLSTRLPGTNRLSLVFAFDATWHRECRPSARGGERSKTAGSWRSLNGGNLTVTARGSEPVSPTVGVENRYSVWPWGPFSPRPLAKTPALGNRTRVEDQPPSAERCGLPMPAAPLRPPVHPTPPLPGGREEGTERLRPASRVP